MYISREQLQRAGVGSNVAGRFVEALTVAAARFQIDRPARMAAFLAQCHVESAGFFRLSENLNYTTANRLMQVWPSRFRTVAVAQAYVRNPEKLANRVYAGRLGNDVEESGDGWRYRGRGIIQLTGKANYSAAAQALQRPYLSTPDLVAEPLDACLTAAWFWFSRDCNRLADAGNIDAITRKVNGPAMLEAAARRRRTQQFMDILSASETVLA